MLKKIQWRYWFTPLITLVTVAALIIVLILSSGAKTKAEEFAETNPDLELALINSRVEELYYSVPAYDCVGTLDRKDDLYTMDTNAFVVWRDQDDVSFAYRRYNIGNKASDVLSAETIVNKRDNANGGGLHSTASVGLMMRESLDPKSPQVFLHCRDGNIAIVYRSQYGGGTFVKYSGVEPVYPVSLKMEKTGTQYTCYYKNAGMSAWVPFTPVGANIGGPVLAGFGGHTSVGPDSFIRGEFKGFSAKGSGTYEETGETIPTSKPTEVPMWEDGPVGSDVLLRETFTDGSLTNAPESITNPVWDSPSGENIITLEDYNRVWYKNFTTSRDFIGNQKWSDYSASVDLAFTKNCDPETENIFRFYIRHRDISYLGMYDYYIQLSGGDTIAIYRRFRSGATTTGTREAYVKIPNYLDAGNWHNLYVEAMDNTLKIFWDDTLVLDYTDNNPSLANLFGCIGLETIDTDVNIDNIVVKKLTDEIGGDYDNKIGGNFDQKIPDYLEQWAGEGNTY